MATLSLTVASCDFCSSDRRFASAFLQIPLALIIVVAMKRTPLVLAVSFPLLGRIRNFHPLVTCAARHTNKKEPCTITRSFSLSYILIYDHELLNIPLIHVFSTYMLGILRIHHPSLHYNMSEFHFLQYQRRLIYQPSPMSVSCQSTSVV